MLTKRTVMPPTINARLKIPCAITLIINMVPFMPPLSAMLNGIRWPGHVRQFVVPVCWLAHAAIRSLVAPPVVRPGRGGRLIRRSSSQGSAGLVGNRTLRARVGQAVIHDGKTEVIKTFNQFNHETYPASTGPNSVSIHHHDPVPGAHFNAFGGSGA